MRLIDADELIKRIPSEEIVSKMAVANAPTAAINQNTGWIPVTCRPITEEEREGYGFDEDVTHIVDCSLPDDGDEILISKLNGKYVYSVEFYNCGDGVGDDCGNDWIHDIDAWMPMPKGYIKEEKT